MIHTSGDLLEFEQLKALIGRYIAGPLGRAELEGVQPGGDRETLESALAEVAEAVTFLRLGNTLPLGGIVDIHTAVQRLRIEGAGLEAQEIGDLTTFLDRVNQVRGEFASASQYPLLTERTQTLADFRPLLRDLSGKILPNGTVADDASVALHRLRRDIDRQKRSIQQSLERFLRARREEGVLQEEYVAIRNDRFVVPVIAGQRRRVEGVIHGASGSGQTLFVEPMETIDLNNELVRLTDEELREVNRILAELTSKLRAHSVEIRHAFGIVSGLDLLFAKAGFAGAFNCVIPRFSPENNRRLHLKAARHPLLEDVLKKRKKPVVPVSLSLDHETRTLLISGPNTGGKTVSMKTAGLLALMAHAAFPVPAEEAEFPIFDQVLADIGDNQSIEQSLSSFSSHVACIKEMVEQATPDSLVLLDELGRATDPEEGGALGVAILDRFRALGAFVLASTHLLALKVYGANTSSVLNGSMGFDEATLDPTFLLRLGAPGKSAGLDIATRLGLPADLIERARAAMSNTERDIARFLAELHQGIEQNNLLRADLQRQIAAAEAREQSVAREWETRESSRLREVERRYEELAGRFEAEARSAIETIIQSAENRKAVEQAQRKVSKTKREFKEQLESAVLAPEAPAGPEQAKPQPQAKIEEGTRVLLKGVRQPATVRRLLAEGAFEVEAGFMKMKVSREDIQEVLSKGQESKLPKNVSFTPGPRWDSSYQEINVIGQRAEEAVDEVEKFLDHAAVTSVERVRIVHGHGMGVLKRAIAELLSKSPHVARFYPASQNEGGAGAVIAELKN